MMKFKFLLLFGCVLLLSSCQSKYMSKQDSWTHTYGYEELPLDSTTYQVTYSGDNSLPAETVDRYALYRAAELTQEKGFDYFVVLDRQQSAQSQSSHLLGMPMSHTHIEHDIDPINGQMIPVAVTTTSQHDYGTTTLTSHTATKMIRMGKGPKPANGAIAFDARTMLNSMAPYINK